jgi:hypothetical protein
MSTGFDPGKLPERIPGHGPIHRVLHTLSGYFLIYPISEDRRDP